MSALGPRLHWDCNGIGDAVKISPRIPSTCVQNAIHLVIIIHIIPSRQIYVDINNSLFIPSVSCLTTCSYVFNYLRAANNVSHAENLQSTGCQCFFNLYKFSNGIQVTQGFRDCGERRGQPVLNEICFLIQDHDFE